MIVVLAIIVIITAVAVSGQNDFNRSLTITDTAYTVALSVRQSQTFGLSSRVFNGTTNAAYGAHFTPANSYLLFADIYPVAPGTSSAYCPSHTAVAGSPDAKPGNCTYDSGNGEVVQNYSFGRGFSITNVCGKDVSRALHCTTTDLTGIDVVYLRPNTDSIITGLRAANGNIKLIDAQIKLQAPSGNGVRYICITQVGEVSVATTTCP